MRRRLHGIDPWRFASADDPEWHPDGDARSTFGARSRSLFDFRTLEAQDQPRVPLRVWSGRCEVFERFTDGARECVVLGQEEAYVGAWRGSDTSWAPLVQIIPVNFRLGPGHRLFLKPDHSPAGRWHRRRHGARSRGGVRVLLWTGLMGCSTSRARAGRARSLMIRWRR